MVELSIEEKITLSDLRAEKSRDTLSDAINNFNAGMYKTSVNRSYYAVLHSARSLLILKGIDPARHEGVKTMLSLHFIRPNLLPKDVIEIFKELMVLRTDVDYGDLEFIGKDEAEKALAQAKRFIETIEPLRSNLIKDCRGE
ncbi:MAG: HEPN domain-containing protein [Thermodesulfovibrionales bacterium]